MDETTQLIIRAQNGDKSAREILIENNLGLVHHIVRRFMGRGYDAEDLFQIGSIGLMKAIDKFDTTFDVKFSTYAVPMIQGEIKRFLRDDGMVKVSRTLKENGWKISQANHAMDQELGREPSLMELSQRTGLSMEEIVTALEANAEIESIYKSVYQSDGNEIYLVDRIPEHKNEHEELMNKMLIEQLLNELGQNERMLIELRYFENKTQVETAGALGISQVQVSRLEKKILLRMRQELLV
ncbi:MAG: SigF/SigG family RNA polymerase sporulation sigma factor [Lachnospiraceae bacterium]|nr:SigF/SigG family RNA polymerase sporulation sigma factor [Lachnospiraceae bacterium]